MPSLIGPELQSNLHHPLLFMDFFTRVIMFFDEQFGYCRSRPEDHFLLLFTQTVKNIQKILNFVYIQTFSCLFSYFSMKRGDYFHWLDVVYISVTKTANVVYISASSYPQRLIYTPPQRLIYTKIPYISGRTFLPWLLPSVESKQPKNAPKKPNNVVYISPATTYIC